MMLRDIREGMAYRKARRRLERVPVPVVMDWAANSIWGAQAALEGFQQTNDEAALHELEAALVGLQAAVEVLLDRAV